MPRALLVSFALLGVGACFYDWEDGGPGGAGPGAQAGGAQGGSAGAPEGGGGSAGATGGGGAGGQPVVECIQATEFACLELCCRRDDEACVIRHSNGPDVASCGAFDIAPCDDGSQMCSAACQPPNGKTDCALCCKGQDAQYTFHCGETIPPGGCPG